MQKLNALACTKDSQIFHEMFDYVFINCMLRQKITLCPLSVILATIFSWSKVTHKSARTPHCAWQETSKDIFMVKTFY